MEAGLDRDEMEKRVLSDPKDCEASRGAAHEQEVIVVPDKLVNVVVG